MADAIIRAQVRSAAGVWTTLFTAAGDTIVSTIRACNISTERDEIDIRLVYGGAAEADEQYLVRGLVLPRGLPFAMTEGLTMDGSDTVFVRSLRGMTAFNLFGVETS